MDKITIVKVGGNVLQNKKVTAQFLKDFASMDGLKILVHGGGNEATELSRKLGIETQMIDGLRVTCSDQLDVTTMVYAGLINKQIVAQLQAIEVNAIGLTGADGGTIQSTKRASQPIDYGWVGDVTSVNADRIICLISAGFVPVFNAITVDEKGQLLNTNADTIAAELAKALSAKFEVSLLYCFEKNGLLQSMNDDDSVISQIHLEAISTLVDNGVISDGMLPKTKNCVEALEANVSHVRIGGPTTIWSPENCTTIKK